MSLPELVNSLPRHLRGSQLTVHSKEKTVNREPLTVNKRQRRFGFTLIELLVVISIIAILMAVATVSYLNAQQKGRDNKRKSDLKAVQQALELYYNQNGKYPDTASGGTDGGKIKCNVGAATIINWNSAFTCNSITYMNPLPRDPVFIEGTDKNYYYFSTSSNTYILSARLENTKDLDWKGNPVTNTSCTPQGWSSPSDPQRNFCVVNP